jgi:6-pyruvoyltetrahydropterin/6-carboxytetrahydropterin synthase
MYEVRVTAQFEAAHLLVGDFGPATRMHGHTYRLEVTARGDRLAADGTLVDIGLLRAAVDELAAGLHYRDLREVPGLAGRNTTAEAVADHCWEALARRLDGLGLGSLAVRVWESPEVAAGRDDELPA